MHIGMFPDSGHHYVFVPVDTATLEKHKLLEQFKSNAAPWQSHEEFPWIRFRAGSKLVGKDYSYGYWVAAESNLGTSSRGFVFRPKRAVNRRSVGASRAKARGPYAFQSPSQIPRDDQVPRVEPLRVQIPIKDGAGTVVERLDLPPIVWMRPQGEPIDVDLVVDFGNTRTIALLLENDRGGRAFEHVCRPVRFVRRGTSYEPFQSQDTSDDPCAIVDSWLVLHEPMFSDTWPPTLAPPVVDEEIEEKLVRDGWFGKQQKVAEITHETEYIPQSFVELSPAILGGGNEIDGARQILADARLEHDANFFLSSPKRYAWDSDPGGIDGGQYWHMELNRWNPRYGQEHVAEPPTLQGPVLLFMDTDGRSWELTDPPNERRNHEQRPHADERTPKHPRRDALTWAALTVLEAAYRQITSQEFRGATGLPFLPRRLRSVLVTFPAGWTTEELECYKKQWQKAVNIFALAHLKNRNECPQLFLNLDEAISSQLPIIYSEILGMGGQGENWIELVGRGASVNAKTRVMNIDIGGGTTDIAVVEYRDTQPGPQVVMEATLLFKNSSAIAGDLLIKRIIERDILPAIGLRLQKEHRSRFEQLFHNTPPEWKDQEKGFRTQLSRIVRLVFIPAATFLLNCISKQRAAEVWETPLSEIRDAAGHQLINLAEVRRFNELVGKFATPGITGNYLSIESAVPVLGVQSLRATLNEVFEPLIQVLGRLNAAFDCDLAIVSGKPSELPQIRELLETALPLIPQRIIFSKNYPAGHWYPVGATEGRIADAKTPTVVGAALSQAMRSHRISGWHLQTNAQFILNKNYWGLIPPGKGRHQFERDAFLRPGENICTTTLLLDSIIGRKRYPSPQLRAEPIYRLRWRDRRRFEQCLLTVTICRDTGAASEQLVLKEVDGVDEEDQPITLDEVELQLCTLDSDGFWMDNPSFEIEWPA